MFADRPAALLAPAGRGRWAVPVNRCAYYRAPDGRPHRETDSKYAPVHLLAEIGKASSVNAAGTVSWSGFAPLEHDAPLRSAIVVLSPDGRELNDTDTSRFLNKALSALARDSPGKPILPQPLIQKIDRLAAEFYRLPPQPRLLVTSLSISSLPAKRMAVDNCVVAALKARGRRYPFPDAVPHGLRPGPMGRYPNQFRYAHVRVSVSGRSDPDAAFRALDIVNLVRALWSLAGTYRSRSYSFGDSTHRPLSPILGGPVHTLHLPTGVPVPGGAYWYDPDYPDLPVATIDSKRWLRMEAYRKNALRSLRKLPYREDALRLLLRYVTALDEVKPEAAFLGLWSLLERLTNTVGANYDETIRRGAWVFDDDYRPIATDTLTCLRGLRNRYVHSGGAENYGGQVVYAIKEFVDLHLARVIANPFEFSTLEEHAALLSMPTTLEGLSARRRVLNAATKFRQSR